MKKVVKIFVFFDLLKLGHNHRNHFQTRSIKTYMLRLRLLVASCYQVITSCHHQYHPSTAIAYEMNLAAKKKKNLALTCRTLLIIFIAVVTKQINNRWDLCDPQYKAFGFDQTWAHNLLV